MDFKVVVHCDDAVEVLPNAELRLFLCSLLWSDMCEAATNVDAKIWSKCLVCDGVFQAEFFITGNDYDYKNAKDAAREFSVLLTLTMTKTLLEMDQAGVF